MAPGGPEGLAAISERGPYAVAVSDMQMPGMDGAAHGTLPDTLDVLVPSERKSAQAPAA